MSTLRSYIPVGTATRAGTLVAGRYRLDRRLGSGGMGTVWAAEDVRLEPPGAIKFLVQHVGTAPHVRRRFEREAKLASKICNQHVVQIFGQGRSASGRPYIVMELLEGE